MDDFPRETLEELVKAQKDTCVSLFMPAHRIGSNGQSMAKEDIIRWKNLVRQTETRLRQEGHRAREIDSWLEPARALIDDPFYWRNQSDGLAAFLAPGVFRTFRVPLRFQELVVVAPRFHVLPLLPLFEDGRFYVLALSQNAVRLIEAARFDAREIHFDKIPRSLEEALQYDDPEKQTQFHTLPSFGSGARAAALYHGHGVGIDDTKERILRFCQLVDRGLAPQLRKSSAPLVLAAVETLAAEYRQSNSYAQLLESIITGNPETLTTQDLHDRAWPLVEPVLMGKRNEAASRYEELRDTSRATHDLAEALVAATDGRIEVLFVPDGVQRWGKFDEAERTVLLHDDSKQGDEDLLNIAAIRTMLASGEVYALPPGKMPGGDAVGALLRY